MIKTPCSGNTFLYFGAFWLPRIDAFQLEPDIRSIFTQDLFQIPETKVYKTSYSTSQYFVSKLLLGRSPDIGNIFEGQIPCSSEKCFCRDSDTDSERFIDLGEYFGSQACITDTDTHR